MLTDNELAMLEQLCYLDSNVASAAGIDDLFSGLGEGYESQTIGQILSVFDDAALERLAANGDVIIDGAVASGAEWASMIRNLQSNEEISSLVLDECMVNDNGVPLALVYHAPGNYTDAIVTFKGTTGGQEWVDNVEGLNTSDTRAQKDALDFIESLSYSNITVVGHSKGGNKAMYVAVLSDKVTRCVSYDGQGFSKEFLDKYWAEIQAKGGIISNYAVSTDFVNILLFPIPGAKLVFVKGYGIGDIRQNHSPNSFFVTDDAGNLVLDANGNPQMIVVAQDESMKMLHEFTTFILNVADDNDKEIIVGYISGLLALVFGKNPPATQEEILNYALSDPDALALIIAYLVKYMDVYDLDAGDIDKLLQALGLNSLDSMFSVKIFDVTIVGLAGFIDFAKKQLTDGKSDKILELILSFFKINGINMKEFWTAIERKVNSLGDIDAATANQNAQSMTGEIRDYSKKSYDKIVDTIERIETSGFESVSPWGSYSAEDWFSTLLINLAINGINSYRNKLTETNTICKTRIDTVFDNISQIDSNYGNLVNNEHVYLQGVKTVITAIADGIN